MPTRRRQITCRTLPRERTSSSGLGEQRDQRRDEGPVSEARGELAAIGRRGGKNCVLAVGGRDKRRCLLSSGRQFVRRVPISPRFNKPHGARIHNVFRAGTHLGAVRPLACAYGRCAADCAWQTRVGSHGRNNAICGPWFQRWVRANCRLKRYPGVIRHT